MPPHSAPASPLGTSSSTPPPLVGGRFAVETKIGDDAFGELLAARDRKTQRPIALRIFSPDLFHSKETLGVLKAQCRVAAELSHPSLVATYGVGSDPRGLPFVATEWIDGSPLSHLVQQRLAQGGHLSVRGAYSVIAHVCKALDYAHGKTVHGGLRPSAVWVSRSGRVKITEFGVFHSVLQTAGCAALDPQEQIYLAPEVKEGKPPDVRSDVFGIGALLYVMLTGQSPAQGFVPPSQARPDATPEIDQVLLRCLAVDPSQRFESADAIRRALLPLVMGTQQTAPGDDFGIDVDIDLDLASEHPPQDPRSAPRPAPPIARQDREPFPGPTAPLTAGMRVSVHEPFRPSLPEPSDVPADAPPEEVDLGAVLARITENDAPRWMVVKDNLDHGPFSGRELVEQILEGEVLGDHKLLNMDTGERREVHEWTDFSEFLAQYEAKRRERDHQVALVRSAKAEKRSNLAKITLAVAIAGILASGVGIFLVSRQAAVNETMQDAELADLYERGEVEISGTAGVLPAPKPRRGGRRQRGAGGKAGGSAGGLSYEAAMNQAVEMNAAKAGGEQQLTSATVAGVMNRHIDSFFGCVGQELRKGGRLGKVQIDLAIAGSGQVIGASVRPGSPAFQSCVAGKVRAIRFPSFSAPRMGARYSFAVD